MTNDEYGQLIEFLGRKFTDVDARLDRVATKDELEAKLGETRRHMGVLVEAVRDDVRQLAEGLNETNRGLAETNQRLDRFQRKVEEEFAETRAAIRFSYAQLERRIQELEGNYASLNARLAPLDSRRLGVRTFVPSYLRTLLVLRPRTSDLDEFRIGCASQPLGFPAAKQRYQECRWQMS